jgi:hypothetical protein
VQFAVDEPEAYRIMFELKQASSRPSPELDAEQKRAFSYLKDAVEQSVAEGELVGDPLTRAHLMWAQVHGLVSLHLAGKLMMGRNLEELRSSWSGFAPTD